MIRALVSVVAFVVVGASAACGGGDDAPPRSPSAVVTNATTSAAPAQTAGAYAPRPGNLLVNPSFEDGPAGWITLSEASGFSVTGERARSGGSSALLRVAETDDASGIKVYYLVQEIVPAAMPDVIEGWYRVENWRAGAPKQYLQFVVIAFGPANFSTQFANWQIRYPLAGIDSVPFRIDNAKFVFLGRQAPVEGEWVHFRTNVREDFVREWGMAPEGFEKLRLLFEVRWEDRAPGANPPAADVYYDDLYAGP